MAKKPKAMGMATLASSLPVAMIPMPTRAGGTEAANKATAQIALTLMRCWVPKGGSQPGRPDASLTSTLEVAFRAQLGQRRVERLAQAAEQVGQLGLVDDQRWADRDPIAHVADEQAARHGLVVDLVAGADRGEVERFLGLLVLHNLERTEHADAHRFADQRMVGKRLEVLLEDRAQPLGVAVQADLVIDLLRLERDRRRHRMAGVGKAVAEGADLVALALQRLVDLVVDHHRRDRQERRRQRLGAG